MADIEPAGDSGSAAGGRSWGLACHNCFSPMRTKPLGWHTSIQGFCHWAWLQGEGGGDPCWSVGYVVHPQSTFPTSSQLGNMDEGKGHCLCLVESTGCRDGLPLIWGGSRAVRVGWVRRWYQGARSLDRGLRHNHTPQKRWRACWSTALCLFWGLRRASIGRPRGRLPGHRSKNRRTACN